MKNIEYYNIETIIMIRKNNTKKNIKKGGKNDYEMLTDDEIFKIADLYFNRKYIMYSHNTNSFNKFIEEDIRHYLVDNEHIFFEMIKDKHIKHKFEFSNISIRPPTKNNGTYMFPADARNENLTYASKLIATVTQIQETIDIYTKKVLERKVIGTAEDNVPIANLPILVRSKYCSLNLRPNVDTRECEYDPGCYFIINGMEKVVISQERLCENKPLVFFRKDAYTVQVNSRSPKIAGIMQATMINLKNNGALMMRVPILNEFPVMIIFRALGFESDSQIIDYIVSDKNDVDMLRVVEHAIRLSVDDEGNMIKTKDEAINYLANKIRIIRKYTETDKELRQKQKKIHLEYLLENNFMPHITTGKIGQAYFIGYMINKLLNCSLGRVEQDDRDSMLNKRVDLVGNLLDDLFRQFFKKLMNECSKYFKKNVPSDGDVRNIINQIRPNTIEQGIKAALLTGMWGKNSKKGVAQVLSRTTYLQSLIFYRRIDSPSSDAASSKLTHPRHVHGTQNGNICAVETPEHAKVGLVKQLTMLGNVTVVSSSQFAIVKKILVDRIISLHDVDPSELFGYCKVFINGDWIGFTKESIKLLNELKEMKYINTIDNTTSITFVEDLNEIRVYCDSGRLYRPLLRVNDNKLLLTKDTISLITPNKSKSNTMITSWDGLMQKYAGMIEYIDSDEQAYSMLSRDKYALKEMYVRENKSREIAGETKELNRTDRYGEMTFVRYTHCEIHPSLLLGLIVTNIPFINHNQGPRNIFQYAQGKQAMCVYSSNYRNRMDTSYVLNHPQKPLVNSRTGKYVNNDVLCPGENAVVAIACYTGWNQEDSIVFNRAAIDRGLFRSISYFGYTSIIQKNQSTSQDEMFTKPDKTKVSGMRNDSYDKLNDRGFVNEETQIVTGDFIIGKITPMNHVGTDGKMYKDNSISYKQYIPGVVDKVYSGIYNNEGYEMTKVKIRSERIPNIGDKFCSRHGQKGTIGVILSQQDMPFTEKGIVPDLIINPNAIPSRMTMAHLLECLLGKMGAIKGTECDGTSFTKIDIESIKKELEKVGYSGTGHEYLYNGMTGQKMDTSIFIGPTYYQRLKHMVSDKMHSRSTGQRTLLLHQPCEGRARGGGMRIGEMERDTLIAHGIAKYIKEKLMDVSDEYKTYVCNKCGLFARRNKKQNDKFVSSSTDLYYCPACNNYTNISQVVIPYAFKLLVQELMSMCIAPRIRTVCDQYNS